MWYEKFFAFYWGFTTKYLIPIALSFLLVSLLKNDIDKAYGGFSVGW